MGGLRLLAMIAGGRSASQVAAALLRTTRAIRRRAEVLSISWKRRPMSASGTKRTFQPHPRMSAIGGRADMHRTSLNVCF